MTTPRSRRPTGAKSGAKSISKPVSFELIQEAAIRLFGEKSYPAVGMRDISGAVGILPGSLYVHISSKEEVLLRIVEEGIQKYLDAIAPVAESDQPAPVRLREAMKAHMRVLATTVEQTKVSFHQWTHLSEKNQRRVIKLRRRYEDLFAGILDQGIKAGEFRETPHPHVVTLGIIGVLNSAAEWYSPTGPLDAESIAEAFADTSIIGLQQTAPAPPKRRRTARAGVA